jgi:hypothetical protein
MGYLLSSPRSDVCADNLPPAPKRVGDLDSPAPHLREYSNAGSDIIFTKVTDMKWSATRSPGSLSLYRRTSSRQA